MKVGRIYISNEIFLRLDVLFMVARSVLYHDNNKDDDDDDGSKQNHQDFRKDTTLVCV